MTDRQRRAIEATIFNIEKKYSNDPRDPGGRTAWGITERDHPEMWVNGPPTKEQAIEFYSETNKEYWQSRYDALVYEPIALELFEAGVLCGPGRAVKFLQEAFNLLLPDLTTWTVLRVDGVFGPVTLATVNRFCAVNDDWCRALYRAMNGEQYLRFKTIANPAFMRGWCAKRLD